MKYLKPKHIIVSIVYLLSLILLAAPGAIGIFERGGAMKVLGIVLMLALTGAYGMYIYSLTQSSQPAGPSLPAQQTPYEKYRDLAEWFRLFEFFGLRNLGGDAKIAMLINSDLGSVDKSAFSYHNPFRQTELGTRIQESIQGITTKYDQTLRMLSDAFNPADITYQNYVSVLDDVLKVSASNARAIKKRVCVFDYRQWSQDENDNMCRQYIDEVSTRAERLEEINTKFDCLIHELVCLDEISEAPLADMQKLIDTTSDYRSLEE